MKKLKLIHVIYAGLFLLIILPDLCNGQEKWEPTKSFETPIKSMDCITWDGNNLWIADNSEKKLYMVSSEDGSVKRSERLDATQATGLAWDGKYLWILDNEMKTLLKTAPATGRTIGQIKAPTPEGEGEWSLEGVTWDGKYLWVAFFAGYSSAIKQVDPTDGKVIESFFADCYPKGLASDGKRLWTLCYNGKNLPVKIDERQISDQAGDFIKSRRFLADLPGSDMKGMAYDGSGFWIIDKATGKLNKFTYRK